MVSAQEEEMVTTVYLPRGLVLAAKPLLFEKEQGHPEATWQSFSGHAEVAMSADRKSFEWILKSPRRGQVYNAVIDWQKP